MVGAILVQVSDKVKHLLLSDAWVMGCDAARRWAIAGVMRCDAARRWAIAGVMEQMALGVCAFGQVRL